MLLPGLDGTEVLLRPLETALSSSFRVATVTYPIEGRNGYRDLYPLVEAAVDRAGAPCSVLGWSFSGPLALRVAAARPQAVRSIILASTFVRRPIPAMAAVSPLFVTPVVASVRALGRLPAWLRRSAEDPLRRDLAQIWERVPARTLAARVRAVHRVHADEQLAACPQPILYLAAARDRIVPRRNLDTIRRIRADLNVGEIPGDHFSIYSNAHAAAELITSFVQRTENDALQAGN